MNYSIKKKMNTPIQVTVDFNIDSIEFDYKKIKALIPSIFNNTSINLQVEEFEEVSIDAEDFYIDIMAFNYNDDNDNADLYDVSLEISDANGKDLNLEISKPGLLDSTKLYETLEELILLAKFGVENKMIS